MITITQRGGTKNIKTLKTGEAGKAVGMKQARGEIIALIDSDNILPSRDWLSFMVEPFHDNLLELNLCITRIARKIAI